MTKIGKSAFLVALSAALCASAKTVFLETESFEDWGGWVNDTQFMDQMGSPYLLAHGLGKPVADAKTHFVLYGRESGVYAVWVRTKNWVAHVYANQGKTPPTASAGTFQVVVNGKAMPMTLGTTRLMRTHGMMGEVVGMAASLCKKHGCDPRGVYTDHLAELKALMEKGVGDGKVHPPQMYNIQTSLDPRFRDRKSGNYQLKR